MPSVCMHDRFQPPVNDIRTLNTFITTLLGLYVYIYAGKGLIVIIYLHIASLWIGANLRHTFGWIYANIMENQHANLT